GLVAPVRAFIFAPPLAEFGVDRHKFARRDVVVDQLRGDGEQRRAAVQDDGAPRRARQQQHAEQRRERQRRQLVARREAREQSGDDVQQIVPPRTTVRAPRRADLQRRVQRETGAEGAEGVVVERVEERRHQGPEARRRDDEQLAPVGRGEPLRQPRQQHQVRDQRQHVERYQNYTDDLPGFARQRPAEQL